MKAVIMCGGSGTRLWPISRKKSPKQFANLFGNKSLFELTVERNLNLVDEIIIVVNKEQLELCKSQVPKIIKDKVRYIIEPVGRNTAPAVTLAALLCDNEDLLILSSDHLIKDQKLYEQCVLNAKELSSNSKLVTFGITAKYPETGYGYIESDGSDVISFKEKPDQATAVKYITAGNYYWNSGMFFFNSNTFLNELKKYAPTILEKSKTALKNAHLKDGVYDISQEDMLSIPEDSIDYAIMEKSDCIKVVPSPFYWSDLGSFDSLYKELEKDDNGNNIRSNYINLNSRNNLVIGDKKLICTYDVSDLIIVDTEDALLVGKKESCQKVKELLSKIKSKNDPNLKNLL